MATTEGNRVFVDTNVLVADVQRFQDYFSITEDGPAVTEKLLEVLRGLAVGLLLCQMPR